MPVYDLQSGHGGQMVYRDDNPSAGRAVVLLHGLGATGDSWQLQIPELAEAGFRVVSPDIPGFGNSNCLDQRWNIRRVTGWVSDLLQSLDLCPLAVVGISMGGTIALQLALDHPEQTDRLVLVNTFARLRAQNWKQIYYFVRRFLTVQFMGPHAQAEFVAARIFPDPKQSPMRRILVGQILQADPRVYRSAMRSLGFFNVERRLKEIKIPTLVVTGQNDSTVSPILQRAMADKIQGAKQVIIPHSGHAVTADQPILFNQVLLDFLNTPG